MVLSLVSGWPNPFGLGRSKARRPAAATVDMQVAGLAMLPEAEARCRPTVAWATLEYPRAQGQPTSAPASPGWLAAHSGNSGRGIFIKSEPSRLNVTQRFREPARTAWFQAIVGVAGPLL